MTGEGGGGCPFCKDIYPLVGTFQRGDQGNNWKSEKYFLSSFQALRKQCQEFGTALLDHTRDIFPPPSHPPSFLIVDTITHFAIKPLYNRVQIHCRFAKKLGIFASMFLLSSFLLYIIVNVVEERHVWYFLFKKSGAATSWKFC